MLTINILNDRTGTDESANYTFDVLVNGKRIDGGTIMGHNRKDDWHSLLQRMLYQNWKVYLERYEGLERRNVRYF